MILLISCSEYSEIETTYQLSVPAWLVGKWENETTEDIWLIESDRIFRNGIQITGYNLDGMDYDSENGYFIEFTPENYFDNYYRAIEHDKVRFVFGNVYGRIESIYRVLNNDVEVYTDSTIYRYIRIN